MEITDEAIENYVDEDLSTYDKKETQKLIEEDGWRENNTYWAQSISMEWKGLTNDKVRILEQSFMNDFSVEEACHQAGISISTFMNSYNNNIDFKNRMNAARDFPFRMWKKKIMQAISSKDFNDYEFILKRIKSRQPSWYWEQQVFQEHNEALTQEDDELLKEILVDKWDERTLAEIKKQEEEEQENEFNKQINDFLADTEQPDAFAWETDFDI